MTITQLQYLIAVAEHKNFTLAAEKSFVTQPTLSMQISKLEEELMKAAYECGYGRVLAGFHYPSDFTVGNLLGEKMYVLMNKMDYGQEVNEDKKSFKDFLKN